MNESKRRAQCTMEYEMEAVRLVRGGQVASGHLEAVGYTQTLGNWVRLEGNGRLKGAGDKPVSPEHMELPRLRSENARLRMERDILKKRWSTSQGNPRELRLDSESYIVCSGVSDLRRAQYERERLL